MRSAIGSSTPSADLTARARIRDVALRRFAERGAAGSTLRGIAAEAGVSPGLIQHHFGSKRGLKAACDAYVLERIRGEVTQAVDERGLGDPAFIETAYQGGPLITRYLVRALLDGSPASAALFDEIVGLTERHLPGDGADAHVRAAVFAAMKLGVRVFQDHLARVLDAGEGARDGYPRILRAMLDVIAPSFVGEDVSARAREGLDRHEERRRDRA